VIHHSLRESSSNWQNSGLQRRVLGVRISPLSPLNFLQDFINTSFMEVFMNRAENRKYHIIYRTTNLINSKFYIGMHSTDNLNDGYMGSGKRILYSLNKWGVENHSFEVLEFCNCRTTMKNRESEIVNEQFLLNPLCLNIALGGGGGFDHFTDEQRLKTQKAAGEASKKFFANLKDQGRYDEWCKNHSFLMSRLISEGKASTPTNYATAFLGRTHSEETRAQMRKSQVGKQVGDKNSQAGTCWIYNPDSNENKKINKAEFEEFLALGWIKGRKIKHDMV
jgi:hypothetical protein